MRNLRNIHRSVITNDDLQSGERSFSAQPSQTSLKPIAIAWDVTTDSVVCGCGPTKDNVLLEIKRWMKYRKDQQSIAAWDAPCPSPNLENDEIVNLHYFADDSTIAVVLAGGDLVVVREEPQHDQEKIEIVGSVDAGISAAAWSPDEALLAITTNASTLLFMSRDFEPVTDITLSSDDLKASNHVSVGWGKKETQFKGKKAHALRDPTMPETVDEGILSNLDTKNTTISWRGDGSFLAVNSMEAGSRRVIRVYSREGDLDSVSEPTDGLVGALSWRPAGNLLAGIQHGWNGVRVIFFERNGLRHGQFDLRLSKEDVVDWASDISLNWNVDSSVLAVCFKDRVQLWTMNNYHYYLKQEIFPLSKNQKVGLTIRWHPEKPFHFALSSQGGVQRMAYAFVVARSPTTPPDDYGAVGVIDGKKVKLTAMRYANIPPPMALHELELDANVIDVAFASKDPNRKLLLVAVLHHNGISVYSWPVHSLAGKGPTLFWHMDRAPTLTFKDSIPVGLVFASNTSLAILSQHHAQSYLAMQKLGDDNNRTCNTLDFGNVVDAIITPGPNSGELTYVANSLGIEARRIIAERIDDYSLEMQHQISLRSFPTPRIEYVRYDYTKRDADSYGLHDNNGGITLSLAEDGSLFANENCLVKNSTSFLLIPGYLIFTTSQNFLKFVHIKGGADTFEIPPDKAEVDERCRKIERGARLVTAILSTFALILQMPRGNLETIYPRALVLAGIRDSIKAKDYKTAFLACRNHRVDMNILYDYDPQQFISNVRSFVDQVKKVEHIDLFLSQLREEDVTKTMYEETLKHGLAMDLQQTQSEAKQIQHIYTKGDLKVNSICDAFLRALEDHSSAHMQNIVTAHVCKAPPDLDAGLTQISKLRKESSDQVDSAVEHICFLADVNRLYDHALGLYDLEMALLIAQQSQKDPREYLPFLQNLQKMPALRRQHSIDDYLRRHPKALKSLCEMNAFEEVKAYAVKHSLHSEGLDFYRYQEERLSEIMRLHADYLQRQGKFKDAGMAYEYLHDYNTASTSYCQAHLWRESLSCAALAHLPKAQLDTLALTLSEDLIESKDFFSAAMINLQHLSDIPTTARLFCKGYFFADALRIISLHNRIDLLETVLDAGLIEGMVSMTELLADCKSQLNAQIPRLRELRTKKAEDPLSFFDGDLPGGADIPDNLSIAPTDASTTGGSLFTRYTNRTGTVGTNATRRTSKNRRREERKRARGKKGSVYEEEYLVNSIGRLIERVNSVSDEVGRLVEGLVRRRMRERARAVEAAMVEVVGLCKGCLADVFPVSKEDESGAQKEAEAEGERPLGGDGVVWDSLLEGKAREAPVVKGFETLSILGG